jgi:hypothetical protein
MEKLPSLVEILGEVGQVTESNPNLHMANPEV